MATDDLPASSDPSNIRPVPRSGAVHGPSQPTRNRTPPAQYGEIHTLSSLADADGRTMGSLAEAWRCDASNATLIVDRLERAGLAERRRMPGDARFRTVHLTPKGGRTRSELLEAFHTPPPELLALTTEELDALRRILGRIPEGAEESGERE